MNLQIELRVADYFACASLGRNNTLCVVGARGEVCQNMEYYRRGMDHNELFVNDEEIDAWWFSWLAIQEAKKIAEGLDQGKKEPSNPIKLRRL